MSATVAAGIPHPTLDGVVLRYSGYTEKSANPVLFHELPCSFVPIIIDLDDGWTLTQAGRPSMRIDSFVAGVTDSTVLVSHDGSASCLQIDLTALGARRLLGIPMSELANRSIPIDEILGADGRTLVQRVGEAADWPARFALVDRAIRARLADMPEPDAGVAWSLRQMAATAGAVSIGALATDLGWSHRRLIARFRDTVGLPPKAVSRIVRFERLAARVADCAAVDWATLAVECGYFDQAHLAREVRELAGLTPTELRALRVNFVQDGGPTTP